MSKMDGQLLQAEKFLLPENVFLVRQFLARDTKKTTKCHSSLLIKPDSAKNNIYKTCKKLREKRMGR